MTSWLFSLTLIKGIDGIVGRPPNKDNYSTLNRKKMKPGKQTGNEISLNNRKCKIFRYHVKHKNTAKHISKKQNNDGTEKVTNIETNTVTHNNDGNNEFNEKTRISKTNRTWNKTKIQIMQNI